MIRKPRTATSSKIRCGRHACDGDASEFNVDGCFFGTDCVFMIVTSSNEGTQAPQRDDVSQWALRTLNQISVTVGLRQSCRRMLWLLPGLSGVIGVTPRHYKNLCSHASTTSASIVLPSSVPTRRKTSRRRCACSLPKSP